MKIMLALVAILALVSCSCSIGQATGFSREVPLSVSSEGLPASLQYLLLTAPEDWDAELNPLNEPGSFDWPDSYTDIHRGNLREIMHNDGFELWEEFNNL